MYNDMNKLISIGTASVALATLMSVSIPVRADSQPELRPVVSIDRGAASGWDELYASRVYRDVSSELAPKYHPVLLSGKRFDLVS